MKSGAQSGYTLVELSVSLAIMAVILVGALMGTRQVMLSNGINNQIRDSANLMAKVQRHYTKQASTAGASTHVLGRMGVWPAERATVTANTTTVRGVLNGSSELIFSNDAAMGSLPANGGFIYTLRNVPTEACADLISAFDTLAFALYAGVSPAAAPTTGATPTLTEVKGADTASVDTAKLASACAPGSPNGVDLAIVFRQ